MSHHYQQQTLHCLSLPHPAHSPSSAHFPSSSSSSSFSSSSSSTSTLRPLSPSLSPSSLSSPACSSPPSSASSASSPSPTMHGAFPNFPRLPPEIRTMVWEYALPEPRVYEVMDVPNAKQKMDAAAGLMFANVHHEPPPPLAAVCRESRGFVLHHYRPLTLGRTTKYVDLNRDLLLLEPYLLLKRLHRTLHFMARIPLIRDHMAGLALGTSYGVYTGICHPVLSWKVAKSNMAKLLTALAKFPKLRSLLFVVHQEFQFEFDCRLPEAAAVPSPSATTPAPPPPVYYSTPNFPTNMMALQRPLPPVPPYSLPSPRSNPPSPSTLPPLGQLPLPPVPPMRAPPAPASSVSPGSTSHPPQVVFQAQAFPAPQPAAPQALRPQVVHQAYRFKFDIESNVNRHPRRPHLNELLFYPLENTKGDRDDEDDWEALLNSGSAGRSAGNGGGSAYDDDDDDNASDNGGEWCDPWPTNDDWRRFRRRFQRAVVATLQAGLANGDGQNAFCVDGAAAAAAAAASSASSGGSSDARLPSMGDKKYQQFLQLQKCGGSGGSYSNNSSSFYDSTYSGYNGPQRCHNMYSLHGSVGGSAGHTGHTLHKGHAGSKNGAGHRRRYSLKHNLPAIKGASLLWRYTRGD